ncbi:MAG: redox-sensing transcriptional repressor Rex [Clostridiales bacterium]|jgi:redox-sensing transcriptional repressor|nr:redox-sensing transcriptional repressor Rex [Clostridiales bacterium]
MDTKEISTAVIKRLPRYYRYLGDLLERGVMRISSMDLSEKMNITASQIRQDLNNFGCFGQQGYGYNVEMLQNEIKRILGLDRTYKLIIIGVGNLGQALAEYDNFEKRGFKFVGLFDVSLGLIGKEIRGVKIQSMSELRGFLQENEIDIAVFSMPKSNAQEVLDIVLKAGIKGIWNFSHLDLKVNKYKGVKVENVHLTDSLMTLSYMLNEDKLKDL